MWVKMCSKEFGITPRKIGSDRTPKDQRKWTAIIVIWIFKLANQLTAFWNNLLASCTSRALFKDIQSRNGSNITCNITFHGECFSCPSLSISKYCAWQGKSASYIINPPTKSPVQPVIRVTMLWSYILPLSLSTQELIPQLGSHMCWCRNTSPCSSMQAKLPKERSARGLAQGMRNYKEYSAFV